MKAANSLKADNYRKSGSHATCCAVCEHFLDNGPNRRLCRIHSLGIASAYSGSVLPTVTHHMVCDKFQMKGLKPCPFCGGQARAYLKISLSADEPEKPLIEARVQCLGCTAEVFGIASIGTPLSPFSVADTAGNAAILRAVAAWNRRAGEGGK